SKASSPRPPRLPNSGNSSRRKPRPIGRSGRNTTSGLSDPRRIDQRAASTEKDYFLETRKDSNFIQPLLDRKYTKAYQLMRVLRHFGHNQIETLSGNSAARILHR